jgi:DNA polymerase-1
MIALIDADIVVYQSAAKAETTTDWGDDTIAITGSKSETEESIDCMVADLKAATAADRVVMVFSDSSNFRKEVYPLYKMNRAGKRKPVTYQYGKDYTEGKYECISRPLLEADDVLGILATTVARGFTGPKVVCSIDKDMLSFPCSLYNWRHPTDGILQIAEVDADFAFFKQILMGDATDGYPGCPGIGPVKAERLLAEHIVIPPAKTGVDSYFNKGEAWKTVVEAYKKKDLCATDAIIQARCARILRACDYDFGARKVLLWEPPCEI